MPRVEHDGMSLWYGTADAPAPLGNVSAAEEVVISVGVTPVDASNSVKVRYRVNQGPIQTVTAKWMRNDIARKAQYFKASLPNLRVGDTVEYAVLCRCAGRQVPSAEQAKHLEHSFRVVDGATESAKETQPTIMPQPGVSETRVVPEMRAGSATSAGVPPPLARSPERRPSRVSVEAPRVSRSLPEPRLRPRIEPKAPPPTLAEVASTMRIERSRELLQALERHSIRTLEDIRSTGGLTHLEGLSTMPKDTVRNLEAHADLSLLPSNLQLNSKLIERGYSGVTAIAATPRRQFVESIQDTLNASEAGQMHAGAQALTHFAEFTLLAHTVGNSFDLPGEVVIKVPEVFPRACGCKNCDSAVSPAAYLADLLDYVTEHMGVWSRQSSILDPPPMFYPVTLSNLRDTFHQDFENLVVSCEAVDAPVRQVRICIEVLRSYLGPGPHPGLDVPVRGYLQTAYRALLARIGTSFESLRLALIAGPEQQATAADRLGIAAAHLPALFFDPSALPPQPRVLTEEALERVFGLAATQLEDGRLPDPFRPRAEPLLLEWRREHLRALWQVQDIPADPYTQRELPIIDPDIVGPDDFRGPRPKPNPTDPDEPFDIWITRRVEVDRMLTDLRAARAAGGLQAMLQQVFGTPLPDLDSLLTRLRQGDDPQATRSKIEALQLTVESFGHLMELREKARQAQGTPPTPPLTGEEWGQVEDLLTQARKQARFPDWITEERNKNVRLGPRAFWISLREPEAGTWPPPPDVARPLIDPEALERSDLPEPQVGQQAQTLWEDRRTALQNVSNMLRMQREANGFDAMLRQALGHPNPGNPLQHDLLTLRNDLAAADPAVADAARARITDDLYLSVEAFSLLVTVRDAAGAGGTAPSASQWAEVYALLTMAHKRKHLFPAWIREENAGGLVYWRARKARLPRWRASVEARPGWQQALRSRSALPIIDPDLTGPADLRDPDPGTSAAARLWTERGTWVETRLQELRGQREGPGDDLAWLDAHLREIVGISWAELMALHEQEQRGADTSGRLEQLDLPRAAFTYLREIGTLVASGQQPLADEWENVYAILLQVEKRRRFGAWREEEAADVLTLSPQHFQRLETSEPVALPPWRVTRSARQEWQDRLQARIDQLATLEAALQQAVQEVEEQVLPMLRDTLILASDAAGPDLETKAEALTSRLLIDMRTGGCQTTTRVSQAIATIQTLIWSIRTGQFDRSELGWILEAPYFEEEWAWLGSYATWRAAVFVLLYPENLLLPSLKRRRSPGFVALLERLRSGGRLNPGNLCSVLQPYVDYYHDITHLAISASCHAPATLLSAPCGDEATGAGYFTFWYALSSSGRCYWSSFRHGEELQHGQSFWTRVPLLDKIVNILGAVPFGGTDQAPEAILVFAKREGGNRRELVVARHDLQTGMWGDTTVLPIPGNATDFAAVVNQIRTVNERPRLAIAIAKQELYEMQIDATGVSWQDEAGDPLPFDHEGYQIELKAMVPVGATAPGAARPYFLFAQRTLPTTIYDLHDSAFAVVRNKTQPISWQKITDLGISAGSGAWVGAFLGSDARDVFALETFRLWRFASGATTPVQAGSWSGGLSSLAVDSGIPEPTGELLLAYDGWRAGLFESPVAGFPIGLHVEQLAPVDTQPEPLDPAAASGTPTFRRNLRRSLYEGNQGGSATNAEYVEEYYYFVPVTIALQLQRRGYFQEALHWFRLVYDFAAPSGDRKIWTRLLEEEGPDATTYTRGPEWLRDPLNPHLIAAGRPNTYSRYTLLAIIRCLLDYADAEFTRDTPESLPRARELYRTARALLNTPFLKQRLGECEELIAYLEQDVRRAVAEASSGWGPVFYSQIRALREIDDPARLGEAVQRVHTALDGDGTWAERAQRVRRVVEDIIPERSEPVRLGARLEEHRRRKMQAVRVLFGQPALAAAGRRLAGSAAQQFAQAASHVIGLGEDPFPPERSPVRRIRSEGVGVDGGTGREAASRQASLYAALPYMLMTWPRPAPGFCIRPNPALEALRLWADLNLHKLRHCQNIAGLERAVAPYSAPTDQETGLPSLGANGALLLPGSVTFQPTPYRYEYLIERAKQLTQYAAQMEAAFLSALEKRDAEAYNLLKARQDVALARAGVQLQAVRVREAEEGVELATLQRERAELQVETYDEWLATPVSYREWQSLEMLRASQLLSVQASVMAAIPNIIAGTASGSIIDFTGIYSSLAQSLSTEATILSTLASYERRAQEWAFQRNLALQDVGINAQQEAVARSHVLVVEQERHISQTQTDHAEAVVDFLANKFLNADLYDWMSRVLEGIYSYFLQQATAVAKLAENQLAFERQEIPPSVIRADYWEAPSEQALPAGGDGNAPDRQGLTGSARLLADIVRLDQYRFETEQRKHQLTKTISLARLSPVEFQRLRETGVMTFSTPLELFDRDFPGHYLRLIKSVRASVIALIPPAEGIKATLSATGQSRVVVRNNGVFQTIPAWRPPESVALSSPRDANGLFQLSPSSPEILLPFEGMGVDATWGFRMPKAANLFDYRTIGDVLLTIEYTALDSALYLQQVIERLGDTVRADRPFSFRHQFADAWYDLHNPEQTATPMTVRFETRREDFPPNIRDLTVQHVVLYFARADGISFEVPVDQLRFTERGGAGSVGGGALSADGIISTRRGNAGSWTAMIGKSPFGEWELALPNTQEMRYRLKKEEIEDILFVITYSGRTPEWPS